MYATPFHAQARVLYYWFQIAPGLIARISDLPCITGPFEICMAGREWSPYHDNSGRTSSISVVCIEETNGCGIRGANRTTDLKG